MKLCQEQSSRGGDKLGDKDYKRAEQMVREILMKIQRGYYPDGRSRRPGAWTARIGIYVFEDGDLND
jgi:hypothetical protein